MKEKEIIVLGADHAGFGVKEYIKKILQKLGYQIEDIGTFTKKIVDYPDYVKRLAKHIKKGSNKRGIFACGTGIGASIAANKIPGIYAALVNNVRDARLSRQHNNANVLVLGGRPYNKKNVKKIVRVWLTTKFQGGRHKRRVSKIIKIEKEHLGSRNRSL